jgi:hypothetical protein
MKSYVQHEQGILCVAIDERKIIHKISFFLQQIKYFIRKSLKIIFNSAEKLSIVSQRIPQEK